MNQTDPYGRNQYCITYGRPDRITKVTIDNTECCAKNGVTPANLRTIADAVLGACDAIGRVIDMLDNHLAAVQDQLKLSTGGQAYTIVNLPPDQLKLFRDALGNCAKKCDNQNVEFSCTDGGGNCGSENNPPFYTNMNRFTGNSSSPMYICSKNNPSGGGLDWAVKHEMGRWCGYQYYGGNAGQGSPWYTSEYWDAIFAALANEPMYKLLGM